MFMYVHFEWEMFILNEKCLIMQNYQTTCLSSSESLGLTSYRKNADSAKYYKIALEKVNVLMWKMDFWNELFENIENSEKSLQRLFFRKKTYGWKSFETSADKLFLVMIHYFKINESNPL